MAKPTTRQQRLFDFLKANSDNGQAFSIAEVCAATKYAATAIGPLASKGHVPWLVRTKPKTYMVKGFKGITLDELLDALSQVKQVGAGAGKVPLTEQDFLLEGAAQEFQLAIELFNRPTTPNRVEAFVVHFINAWEKLLKARLVKRDGADSIWTKDRERKSISLRTALDRWYPATDHVRRNVEYIEDLRDDATHFMLPALDAIASRYFQAGVMNFFGEYMAASGHAPLRMNGVGLMSLVIDAAELTPATLMLQYGEQRGRRILERIRQLEHAASEVNDSSFAIPLNLSVGIVDKQTNPEQTIAGMMGMLPIVVNKPVDPKKSHPHAVNHVVAEVNKRLRSRFNDDTLRKLLSRTKKVEFNTHDFTSISSFEGWKKNSNKYHFDHGTIVQHTYSDACIDLIVDKLTKHPDYLGRAKKKEVEKRKRKK